jgi:hypothetical protein
MNVSAPKHEWVELSRGEWELQTEHAYYRIHFNRVTEKWHLGRRILPGTPIQIVGVYVSLEDAQAAAERAASSL